jgi:hypothetical protein
MGIQRPVFRLFQDRHIKEVVEDHLTSLDLEIAIQSLRNHLSFLKEPKYRLF